jgi:hypothetical protein
VPLKLLRLGALFYLRLGSLIEVLFFWKPWTPRAPARISIAPWGESRAGGAPIGALWRLHELDIRDKHRLLVPVGAAKPGIAVRFRMQLPDGRTIDAPAVGMQPTGNSLLKTAQ